VTFRTIHNPQGGEIGGHLYSVPANFISNTIEFPKIHLSADKPVAHPPPMALMAW
jgi:hypothetical protein